MEKKKEGAKVRARAKQWHSVPNPRAGNKEDVEVPIPVDVEIDLNKKGRNPVGQSGIKQADSKRDTIAKCLMECALLGYGAVKQLRPQCVLVGCAPKLQFKERATFAVSPLIFNSRDLISQALHFPFSRNA